MIGTVPLGSWKTITFVAALRHNKMTAPMVVEGAMTGEMFFAACRLCFNMTGIRFSRCYLRRRSRLQLKGDLFGMIVLIVAYKS